MLPSIDSRMYVEAFQHRRHPVTCPDCGAAWPVNEDRCPGCLLAVDDLAAAAELLDLIDRRARGFAP